MSEEEKESGANENVNEGDKPEENDPLAQVRALKQELDKAREEASKVRDELKHLETQRILSGESRAGQQPAKPRELTPEEYADKALQGII